MIDAKETAASGELHCAGDYLASNPPNAGQNPNVLLNTSTIRKNNKSNPEKEHEVEQYTIAIQVLSSF